MGMESRVAVLLAEDTRHALSSSSRTGTGKTGAAAGGWSPTGQGRKWGAAHHDLDLIPKSEAFNTLQETVWPVSPDSLMARQSRLPGREAIASA